MNQRRLAVALLATVALGACTDNTADEVNDAASDATIAVSSTENECALSTTTAESGNVIFEVANDGDDVTEFYLLGDDGLRIVGEVENIGPGLSRRLVVLAQPGEYVAACKPGMVGDGIRAAFTVTDSGKEVGPTGARAELLDTATTQYAAYVKDQSEQLLTATREFAVLYTAGDDDAARALYPNARMHWERI
ncbi:MAG: PbrT family lead (Pb2+) uptake porter, partial [Actinobacteria bacterium]|nr:PbrT family lead (Pb2+) uptake porter [Actinomycetota bacterium]